MRLNRLFMGLAGFALLLTNACAGYNVVKQATPNPFVGKKAFAVAPIDFGDHTTGDDVKAEINKSFKEELADELGSDFQLVEPGANPEAFTVALKVYNLKEGQPMNLQMNPAVLGVDVMIMQGDQVLDQIKVEKIMNRPPASIGGIPMGGFTVSQRLGGLADDVAEDVGGYIEDRVAGP